VTTSRKGPPDQSLGRILPERLSGSEPLHDRGTAVGGSVLDFWQWAGSDLVANTFRGWLAEYIVARALGIPRDVRQDWLAYDLEAHGVRIEVKASAYVQSWAQKKLSTPKFSIRPARAWDPDTDTMTDTVGRRSDVYVFCLHAHTVQETLNPLDVSQWQFYVVPTEAIDKELTNQKTVGLTTLEQLGAKACRFDELGDVVQYLVCSVLNVGPGQ
jgi:hypothetical protein